MFRYRPLLNGVPLDEDLADRLNPAIRAAVFASGEAVVAGTTVHGRHHLKFTLLNAETRLSDIQDIIELLRRTGADLLGTLTAPRDDAAVSSVSSDQKDLSA